MSGAAPVVCGVDLGSTKLKVLLLAADGTVLWRESRPTPHQVDDAGAATDADALLGLVEAMMIAACRGAGMAQPLRAVAVAGTGEEGVPVDAQGAALDSAVRWHDRRAAAITDEMAHRPLWSAAPLPVDLDYSRTAAKWAWGRGYRPGPLAAARSWVTLTDYPAARWTGARFMSESLAARTACWHIGDRRWIPALLADCGAPPLPEVVPAGTVLGRLRSPALAAAEVVDDTTLVVAGGHDHPVAAFAVRQRYPDAIFDSMGTAELIYAEIPPRPDGGQPARHPLFAFSHPVRGAGIACLGVTELSAVLEPLLDDGGMLGQQFRAVMAGETVPGAPGAGPALRDRLEAVTVETQARLHALAALGVPDGPLLTGGGWARSESFLRLRASLLGRTIQRVEEAELTAYGAALLAAGAAGCMPPPALETKLIEPDPGWASAYAAREPAAMRGKVAT
jgi:xylulokinase